MIKWSTKCQNDALDALRVMFANGVIEIYSGSQPVNADAPIQGTLLGVVTVGAAPFVAGQPANGLNFGAAANGMLFKNPAEIWQFTGLTAGVAGWYRFKGNAPDSGAQDAAGEHPRMDGRIATSGAEMNMGNTTVEAGRIRTVDSFDIPMPASYR